VQLKDTLISEVITARAVSAGRTELERALLPLRSLVTWMVVLITGGAHAPAPLLLPAACPSWREPGAAACIYPPGNSGHSALRHCKLVALRPRAGAAAGISLCGTLGINLQPVLAVGGAGGLAAGFASQQVLQNVVSGVNIVSAMAGMGGPACGRSAHASCGCSARLPAPWSIFWLVP
jgi:hypothetical protein